MIRFLSLFSLVFLSVTPIWAETEIKEVISPAGTRIWLVEEPSIPFLSLQLVFRGGTSLDAPEKSGATYLMAGLLEEGTGDLDAAGFLTERERLAADFSYDASRDQVAISAKVLSENRDQALDLLRRSLVEPAFNATAFDRVKAQILSMIKSNATDPDEIANQTMDQLMFPDHPYSRPSEGRLETVTALTIADMGQAHRNALTKDRVFIGVVGDVNKTEIGPIIDALLSGLPETGGPDLSLTQVQSSGGITVVDFDTPQSVAVFGHGGIARDDPDFFAAYVMNHILGGGSFSSRLTTEVREKRGLTYGVYSYLAPYDLAAVYGGGVSSANDRISEAVAVIQDEWRRMAEEGVSQDELDQAKKYLTGAYPLRFDGNERIASMLAGMQLSGLDVDYIKTRNDKVNAVTRAEVNRVARYLLRPENLRFVVVGKPVGLNPTD